MSDLIQIETPHKGYHKRRMIGGGAEFWAKQTDGGGWYYLIFSDGSRVKHLTYVIESISEEVKDGDSTGK